MKKSNRDQKRERNQKRELAKGKRRGGRSGRVKRWGVIDIETDPFRFGRVPVPFCAAVLTSLDEFELFWGDQCIELLAQFIDENRGEYYAHNGGRFDFHYLLPYVEKSTVRVINGRIAKMSVGESTMMDSFCIAPFALDSYRKQSIDYSWFERGERRKHRKDIESYLESDCRNLYALIEGFHATLGKKLTIGSCAFAALKKLGHSPPQGNATHDARFRRFYFGGRNQAFRHGHFKRVKLGYFDINSAYPWSMTHSHPWSLAYSESQTLPRDLGPQLIHLTGRSRGALPFRDPESGKILYDDAKREWFVTGWEVSAALETNSLDIERINLCYAFKETRSFENFVEETYAKRTAAKRSGDRISELAYKYLLNSSYGKFASNPANYRDFKIIEHNEALPVPWRFEGDLEGSDFSVWSEPSPEFRGFFNVATAASITGLVRSHLWRALNTGDPWYCDTDSIIGEGYRVALSDQLGEWKDEGTISEIAIAGRKLYAAKVEKAWKVASKGSKLGFVDVLEIAKGAEKIWRNEAPTFSLSGATFITRRIKSTRV